MGIKEDRFVVGRQVDEDVGHGGNSLPCFQPNLSYRRGPGQRERRQRIKPPIRFLTKRPAIDPPNSVAIAPAPAVTALRVGSERDLRPESLAARTVATELAAAPAAALLPFSHQDVVLRGRLRTSSSPFS